MAFLLIAVFTGCSGSKLVLTTGLGRSDVFRIGEEVCSVPELMVYMTNLQNRYEESFGPEVWDIERKGVTMEDNIKEIALEQMAQLKAMYALAKKHEVTLDDMEQGQVKKAAETYFSSLNETEKELMEVDLETVFKLYEMYTLAQKVYRVAIKDVNPEISDDEARAITVQQIKLGTYEEASEIRSMAVQDGEDFMTLATKYSQDTNITHSFCKGERSEEIEEVAFNLATDEISSVIEAEDGYYILKCITTYDEEQTNLNKEKMAEERRKEIFTKEYNDFVATLVPQLNKSCWKKIKILRDEEVTTSNFFEIYEQICPKY